jgi:sarcosine oxidase subunit alpha
MTRITKTANLIGPGHLSFTFNGKTIAARQGDTVASALLANGVKLVGRSFKYHRPRGVLTAGSEEPNALIQTGTGDAMLPNIRATTQEAYQGLHTASQNHIGPLAYDIMSVNDVLSPFLGAGFYYKTFMWPQAFWEKIYEPAIRRAAGLGRITRHATSLEENERGFAFCDLLVIGGGPAGLMAAWTAAQNGADVILAEETPALGGRLIADAEQLDGMAAQDWVAAMRAKLANMGNVRIMTRTTVTGVYDGLTFGAVERVSTHKPYRENCPRECFWRIRAKQAVLAAGALERPIAFPFNDRPGIMMAGALRSYLNNYGVACGQNITIFANNDEAHRTALQMQAAGLSIAAVIDSRPHAQAQGDYRLIAGGQVTGTKGRQALRQITVTHARGQDHIATDCLAMSGGWNPTVHLSCHLGARPVWADAIAAFVPAQNAIAGLHPAGACRGIYATRDCLGDGVRAALDAAIALGLTARAPDIAIARNDAGGTEPLWSVPGRGRAWLDFANDVTTKDVNLSAQEGFRSVEHMKRYTTQGMAPDQGKMSNIAALAVLADATQQGISETGTTTYRPPYTPVALATLGAGARGHGFAPERKTTSHKASMARNAPMVEVGLWYRASYFPRPGETHWRESCDREVQMVRNAVGVVDVSTLGKIDIQGPDAAAFLDFVYANMISTLKPGRVRYGVMLREDGHVMDDGTAARLGDRHFVITTTTAAAGQVMAHLDFVRQVLRPDFDVQIASVTEQWAQFSVAGPRARDVINGVLDTPIDNDSFPFMSCGDMRMRGVAGRVFRISFSGEQAYEIAVPARYGDALYRDLVTKAEALGGGAYGLEALNILRLEKGFVTHAEMHGRVTAFDMGLQAMLSKKKDFIGKAAATRPGLLAPGRPGLIGLKPVDGKGDLTAGAHIFDQGAAHIRVNSQGYVTSAGHSPTMGMYIGLGFVKNGPARHGEYVMMVDHLRNIQTLCEICDPVFFDPDGGRADG